MILKDEIDKAGPVVDRLNAAIRDNPLAAGFIGAGVAWMLFGGAKGFGVMAGVAKGAAVKSGSAVAAAGHTVASGVAKTGSTVAAGVKNVASDAAGSIASIVPDLSMPDTGNAFEAVAEVQSSIGNGISSAAAAGREYGAAIQSRLSASFEQQPLLLGAIGSPWRNHPRPSLQRRSRRMMSEQERPFAKSCRASHTVTSCSRLLPK